MFALFPSSIAFNVFYLEIAFDVIFAHRNAAQTSSNEVILEVRNSEFEICIDQKYRLIQRCW